MQIERVSHRAPSRRATCAASIAAACVVTALVSAPRDAAASGYGTARFGGEHGHPTTDNPTAIYFNPAGLADRDPDAEKKFEFHLFVDNNLAFRSLNWRHGKSATDIEPADAPGSNSGENGLFNVLASPMAGVNFKIDNFAVGAGVYFPFGGQASWDKDETWAGNAKYPGPVDGVQRWHTIDGTIRTMYISLGVAYDIASRVSIGASFNLARSEVNTIRARIADGTNDPAAEGRSLVDVSGWNGAFGVGILGEVVPRKLWLGASYQSEPGVAGDQVLEGTLTNYFNGPQPVVDVKLFQEMPAVYRIGLRARPIEEMEFRFSGEVIGWNVFRRQCLANATDDACDANRDGSPKEGAPVQNIARDWSTGLGIRVGASWFASKAVELFGGIGYDNNVVPDSTLEPALQDYHDISPGVGARFSAGDIFDIAISYTQFIYFGRDTTGKSSLPNLEPPSRTPDSGGEYSQVLGVVNTNVELSF